METRALRLLILTGCMLAVLLAAGALAAGAAPARPVTSAAATAQAEGRHAGPGEDRAGLAQRAGSERHGHVHRLHAR